MEVTQGDGSAVGFGRSKIVTVTQKAADASILVLPHRVKKAYPNKEIWCYSCYILDGELWQPSRTRCECTGELLYLIDVPVDGAMTIQAIQ
ncbi:MAG TPA: hypothetical protein IAC25_06530 [Candidatus Enterenecus stercoripullorum]|nr:hypothetical protein [Candidatus Enterenecus stercoripullorum]